MGQICSTAAITTRVGITPQSLVVLWIQIPKVERCLFERKNGATHFPRVTARGTRRALLATFSLANIDYLCVHCMLLEKLAEKQCVLDPQEDMRIRMPCDVCSAEEVMHIFHLFVLKYTTTLTAVGTKYGR